MKTIIPFIAVLAMGAVAAGVEPKPSPDNPAGQALCLAVKPTAGELRWQKIPWLTDLGQAQAVAREEKRPILLWVTGDDPLERC